ncbi:MAG: hypothetical protein Q9190_007380 [Brigantiaea leucoxantha]
MADACFEIKKESFRPSYYRISSDGSSQEQDADQKEEELANNAGVMEDLSFMIFGDEEGSAEADRLGLATIHWSRKEGCSNQENCNDSVMQEEAQQHLESSAGSPILFG